LEKGYQLGANKNEIRIVFVFVCIRRVKATKMGKSRSNYSFMFLFLSRIRKGLTASAASSDVFAIRQAQNKLTTEPIGACWLEK
jgi:hypothetical protein